MENGLTTIEPKAPDLLRPIASPAEIMQSQKAVYEIIRTNLKDGQDYGTIPGCGPKAALFKAGAERINTAFGAVPHYDVVDSEIDHNREVPWKKFNKSGVSYGAYRFTVKCTLKLWDGRIVGQGIGSCSTYESKYIERPRDSENTVLKMAQKRAMVAATLNAYSLSDRFTQDIEDTRVDASAQKVAGATKEGFNPGSKAHTDWLHKELEKRSIPDAAWAGISKALAGRPSGDLESVIASSEIAAMT